MPAGIGSRASSRVHSSTVSSPILSRLLFATTHKRPAWSSAMAVSLDPRRRSSIAALCRSMRPPGVRCSMMPLKPPSHTPPSLAGAIARYTLPDKPPAPCVYCASRRQSDRR